MRWFPATKEFSLTAFHSFHTILCLSPGHYWVSVNPRNFSVIVYPCENWPVRLWLVVFLGDGMGGGVYSTNQRPKWMRNGHLTARRTGASAFHGWWLCSSRPAGRLPRMRLVGSPLRTQSWRFFHRSMWWILAIYSRWSQSRSYFDVDSLRSFLLLHHRHLLS